MSLLGYFALSQKSTKTVSNPYNIASLVHSLARPVQNCMLQFYYYYNMAEAATITMKYIYHRVRSPIVTKALQADTKWQKFTLIIQQQSCK